MPSDALRAFKRASLEVKHLLAADATPTGSLPSNPDQAMAIGRGSVVLLSSHFERYVTWINEQAVEAVVASGAGPLLLPARLRLQHSQVVVAAINEPSWDNRADVLVVMAEEAQLWLPGGSAAVIHHENLLRWFRAPTPERLVRFYGMWGIGDIFDAVTRKASTRSDLWLRIGELVGKRNHIAHGDASVGASRSEIKDYIAATKTLCERADRTLARSLAKHLSIVSPW